MLAEQLKNHDDTPRDDLPHLLGFLDRPTTSQAMREYRAALNAPQP